MRHSIVGAIAFAGLALRALTAPDSATSLAVNASLPPPAAAFSAASARILRKRAVKRPVFAHVVQGDFQNYSEEDYAADFALANEAGIVAFAMNVGNDDSDPAQMTKAFSAASSSSFSLFFSFDMNYFATPGSSDAILNKYLKPFAAHGAHYLWEGKVMVSTFSGETSGTSLDGTGSFEDSNEKWKTLLDHAAGELGKEVRAVSASLVSSTDVSKTQIAYVPDWNNVALVSSQSYGGGIMSWAAWGDRGRADVMTTASDESESSCTLLSRARADQALPTLASTSPPPTPPLCETLRTLEPSALGFWLSPTLLIQEDLINLDPGPAAIDLLSWNDFGEAHYLGPVRESAGIPGLSTKYIDTTRDHTPMLWLSAYWNLWFTNGSPPRIKSECVIWYHRPHPAAATASSDELGKPEYAETLGDKIFAVVFVPSGSRAAELVIITGGQATDGQDVKEGINLVSADFSPGATAVSLQDSSGNVLLAGAGVEVTDSPATHDYNFRAYIVPEDCTASSFLDGIASSSSGNGAAEDGAMGSSAGAIRTAPDGGSAMTPSTSQTKRPSASTATCGGGCTGPSDGSGSSEADPSGDGSASSAPSASDTPGDDRFGVPVWGWVAGAAGIVTLGVGAFFLIARSSVRQEGRRVVASSDSYSSEDSDGSDGEVSSDQETKQGRASIRT
ncbi:hypothetical protein JCM11251_001246 [Rhodosporidiobolus azoricus]